MKYFLMSLGLVISSVSAAVPTEQALELCRSEQNALKRLLCYDAINVNTAVITKTSSLPTTIPTNQVTIATEPTTNADNNFGLEHKQFDKDAADSIYVTVKSVGYTVHKELKVEFENGQKWQQLGTEYYPIAIGERHIIKRGALNSFKLGNAYKARVIKIRREQ